MIKPTEDVIRAIIGLENNAYWQEIVDWIDKSLVMQSMKNNHLIGEIAIKGQGRGIELEELLSNIKNASRYEENKKV